MRRRAAGRHAAVEVSLRAFGWERPAVAALRHETLPWVDSFVLEQTLDAVPLTSLQDLGGRDKLSLVAQFAAHQAFLQFAGIADGECDPNEWAVVQKRGTDCRLLRIAARSTGGDAPPLTIIQQFAEAIEAPELDVLRQSWARAESVYCEVEARLRRDAAADLRWMRRAAAGEIVGPGVEPLRALLAQRGGRFSYRDPACIESIRNAALLGGEKVIVIGEQASPLQRYSAIEPLSILAGPLRDRGESEIVERVVAACAGQRVIVIVPKRDAFDPASRAVLKMLAATDAATWLEAGSDAQELPESRFFVLSSRLEPLRELRISSRAWLEHFVVSHAFLRFLDDGELPHEPAALDSLREPQRSYVAALALLGTRIPRALATRFLAEFVLGEPDVDVVVPGVTTLDNECIVFASDAVRDAARALIPAASRPTLCRVAATAAEDNGDHRRAAELLVDAGDPARAAELLERVQWPSPEKSIRALRILPRAALTPALACTLAGALLQCGRYRDAREIAETLAGDVRELALARIERRTGDYAPALARLERIVQPTFESELLRGELLLLGNRFDEARAAFDRCTPANDDERARHGYAMTVLAIERGEHDEAAWMLIDTPSREYLVARADSYRAVARGDVDAAIDAADRAIASATSIADRIDAMLDRLFALFSSGRWSECRAEAMRSLAAIEETQGDRAAGGVLFTLAYLCADDGQWAHAAQRIARLRHFYGSARDERRLAELDLLNAQLDFSRGRFEAARETALNVMGGKVSPQIREAAALIADETTDGPLLSTGSSGNVELTDRHALLRARRGLNGVPIAGAFTRALIAWERGDATAPLPSTGSEALKLFRSALRRGDRELAERIARQMGIEMETRGDGSAELRILHAAAVREFPYAANDLGSARWRFATRNRLGHWSEIGSLDALPASELDSILAGGAKDWIAVSERELLFVEGISRWSPESREALAAIIRNRAEHHRLQRVIEQEESSRTTARPEAIDGIVGDSPAMREVFALIARVAKRDVPVCILGESGTGKELIARAVHRNSARRSKTFTAVNCAALPENLIESELFGHARGAFTGADRDHAGLIETTDGGTLFLDEIGEMPLPAQAKLLRFLQEGEFRRVGDVNNRSADVRIVTATNRKLESAVEEGRFREDLYYRIRVVEIALPPLRERVSDIALLAAHFVNAEREKHRGGAAKLTPDAEAAILAYAWPGNVRELQNTIRAAHALAGDAKMIDLDHLPERVRGASRGGAVTSSYHDAVARFRRDLIEKSLAQVMGNQNQAAALLKISRQALAYQIRELGILVRY